MLIHSQINHVLVCVRNPQMWHILCHCPEKHVDFVSPLPASPSADHAGTKCETPKISISQCWAMISLAGWVYIVCPPKMWVSAVSQSEKTIVLYLSHGWSAYGTRKNVGYLSWQWRSGSTCFQNTVNLAVLVFPQLIILQYLRSPPDYLTFFCCPICWSPMGQKSNTHFSPSVIIYILDIIYTNARKSLVHRQITHTFLLITLNLCQELSRRDRHTILSQSWSLNHNK